MTATDISRHARKANRAAGALPAESFATAPELNRKVPSDLSPQVFAHRTGITNEERDADPALAAAFGAANAMSSGLEDIYRRERSIRADSTRTREAHNLLVGKMTEKQSAEPLGAADTAHKTVRRALGEIEQEIESRFKSRLPREDAAELRAVLRSMTKKTRSEFLGKCRKDGDFDTIAAVLAQKPVASGLTEQEAARLRHEFEVTHCRELIDRRAKLQKAEAELMRAGQSFLKATLSMTDPEEIRRLAEAERAAAEAVG